MVANSYTGPINSSADWAKAVLTDGGAPVTDTNVSNMLTWMQNENYPSTWATRNNPLNASLGTSASDGTGSYPDLRTSAYYSAQMIFGQPNMAGIAAALSNSAPRAAFGQAVIASPWASSHYGGDLSRFTGSNAVVVGGVGGSTTVGAIQGLEPFEGPRYLGLINPSRCVFGNFGGFFGVGSFCIVDAQAARKIKGYTVMSVGGFGVILGIALVFGIGLRTPLPGTGGITKLGAKIPGPVGMVSRKPAGYRGGGTNPQTFGGRPSVSSADRRELEQRRADEARVRARQQSDEAERREGFSHVPRGRQPGTRTPAERRAASRR